MKIITQKEILSEMADGLAKQEKCVIVDYTANHVNYGFDDKPNFEYCKAHKIQTVDIKRRGGVFVINKGDIGFGYITKSLDNSMGVKLYEATIDLLKSKGLNVTTDNNDILIDGYKVFGWASNYYKEYDAIYITAHFTMSVDLPLIKNICLKPMVKVPKGLTDFGITASEIKEFIYETIQQ